MHISDWSSDVCSSDLQKSVSGLGIASLRCAFSKASTIRTTSQTARRTYPRRPISISVNMPQMIAASRPYQKERMWKLYWIGTQGSCGFFFQKYARTRGREAGGAGKSVTKRVDLGGGP